MIKNKNFIGLILICFLILGLLTITNFLNLYNNEQLNLVIEKDNDTNYECVLIKNIESYQEFLTKYGIKESKGTKNKDFQKYDYIASFIPYKEPLEIKNVDVIWDKEITIYYEIEPKIEENSDKLLIYFIPIDKNAINTLGNVKQIYN